MLVSVSTFFTDTKLPFGREHWIPLTQRAKILGRKHYDARTSLAS